MSEDNIQKLIDEIEDYIGGNVVGCEDDDGDIDWMGLTVFLRDKLTEALIPRDAEIAALKKENELLRATQQTASNQDLEAKLQRAERVCNAAIKETNYRQGLYCSEEFKEAVREWEQPAKEGE